MAVAVDHHGHDAHDDHGNHEIPYAQQLKANRMGLWLFCLSEVFLFAALIGARFYLWGNTRPELNQELALITTCILLVSSIYMARAEAAAEHGDKKTFLNSLVITFVMGLIFLLGVVLFEWGLVPLGGEHHLKPTDGAYGAVFFAMTGMHAIHVVTGLIFIFIVWNNGRRDRYTTEKHWAVEACAVYWHYVDVIWIFFYPILYLIGTPFHL